MNHSLLPSKAGASLPAKYEEAKMALSECNRIDECKDWSDKAQALASYAKQADDKEMEKTAMRIRARAVRRCGELLKEIEKGHGKNQNIMDGGDPKVQTRKDAATEAGLSERQAKQSIRVSNVDKEDFEDQLESDTPPTITNLAEQGTRKLSPIEEGMANGIPVYVQLGITKKAFQASMYCGGSIHDFAKELQKYSLQDVVDGSSSEERVKLRKSIEIIDACLDQIIAKL